MRPRGRFLLALAAGLYLLGTVIWAGAERRSPRQFLDPGSALNDGGRGASLARAYLKARLRSASLLTRPVSAAELPGDGVVFRLEPGGVPWQPARREAPVAKRRGKKGKTDTDKKKHTDGDTDDDTDEHEEDPHPGRFAPLLTAEEEEWVRGGGRLVLGLAGSYGPVWAEEEKSRERLEKVYPLWPSVATLRPPVRRALHGPGLARTQAVMLAGESPVLARLPLGRGEVVLLACPEILENAHLAVADHLALLEALAGGRPALFDEMAHGLGSTTGPLDLLARWGLGPALLLAGLAALAAVSRRAVRVGPPERDDPDVRSDAVDLVDSLGELYDRALSRGEAVRLYWEGFVHAVGVESGLSGLRLAARARELAAGFTPPSPGEDLSREGFQRALATINTAYRTARRAAGRRARDGKHDGP